MKMKTKLKKAKKIIDIFVIKVKLFLFYFCKLIITYYHQEVASMICAQCADNEAVIQSKNCEKQMQLDKITALVNYYLENINKLWWINSLL